MRRSFLQAVFFVSLLVFQLPVLGQPFTLVKDINAGTLNHCIGPSPQFSNLTGSGASLFFTVYTVSSAGLWKSDGSNAGTVRIKEVFGIETLINTNGVLFFSAYNSTLGQKEIWKSDGTEAGTVLLKSWPNSIISYMTGINGTLYFELFSSGSSYELWKSDGTDAGTVVVKAFNNLQDLVNIDGTLFFVANDGPPFRNNLWKSDGTTAGTVLVKDIYAGSGSTSMTNFFDADGILYFIGNDGVNGEELWKSDGTDAGTVMIKDIEPGLNGSNIRSLAFANNTIYFFAYTTASGISLWKSDGTAGGTDLVKDLSDSDSPNYLTNVNGTLYFQGYDDNNGAELWKSDGTDAGTVMIKDILPGADGGFPNGSYPTSLINVNGTLFFSANNELVPPGLGPTDCATTGELWKSDGTETGTVLVKDIYKGIGGSAPEGFILVNGALFFKANNGLNGRELWKSDGTANGTVLVKDIFTTNGSRPQMFTPMNGRVYFTAFNGDQGPAYGRGTEVYQTDGTLENTLQSTWIFTLGGSSPREIINHNGELFISATNGSHGYELWKTDGLGLYTGGTTTWVKDINPYLGILEDRGSNPSQLTSVNQLLFFSANDGTNGYELWKSDGTSDGTVMIKNINPTGSSNPSNLRNVNGVLYFTADNGTDGIELWKSDGTDAGTVLVKNINAGSNSSNPLYLTAVNGVLYFAADDGVNGIELWKSDGTDAGTVLVKNINAAIDSSNPASLTNINGVLYFSADDGVSGVEVWKSDGTDGGTVLVKDIYSGAGSSDPSLFAGINGVAVFAADNGIAGRELWRSDGTADGTVLVKDIRPGNIGSNPSVLTRVGNNVLFAANDGVRGNEVWLSNGAGQGTRVMSEIEPGVNGSDPTEIFEYGAKVLVSATNALVGSEVWIADIPAGGPLPIELLEFKGIIVKSDGLLQWKTDNEINTSSFIVERSIDGRNYKSIGSVPAANTPGIHFYDYTESNIVSLGVSNIFYRLKQIDIDGWYTYSNIVVLSIDNSRPVVMLYPNPAKDNLNMTINVSRQEKLQWQLADNTGRIVKRGNYNLSAGSTAVSIDITGLSSGMYIIQLNGSTLQQVIKVIKQ